MIPALCISTLKLDIEPSRAPINIKLVESLYHCYSFLTSSFFHFIIQINQVKMGDIRDLHIAIMGAGMGGLGTALALAKKGFKHIDVYESASNLGFVGAGIQMAPNMGRILDKLGCWTEIERDSTHVTGSSIRRMTMKPRRCTC